MEPRKRPKTRVVMTVANEFTTDYRVHREAKALVDAGYDVTLFCMWREGLPRTEELDGIHVRRILDSYIRLPFSRSALRVRKIWKRALFDARADIYHAHDRDTLDYTSKVARSLNKPFVYDSHEYWPDKNQYTSNTGSIRDRVSEYIWTLKEKYHARKATRIIMTSPGHARGLVNKFGVQQPTLVRNICEYIRGTDSNYLRNYFHLRADDIILGYVGNIQRNRGLEETIAGLSLLPTNVHFVIIGYGPYREELKNAIPAQLTKRVHFHDTIPYRKIVPVLHSADIGVAPFQANCYSHRHVLPNKIFEYMMAELPLALSDLPDMRAVVEEAGAGVFFDPADPKSIAAAIQKLLDDPTLREQLKNRARTASENKYRWDLEKNNLLKLYKELA